MLFFEINKETLKSDQNNSVFTHILAYILTNIDICLFLIHLIRKRHTELLRSHEMPCEIQPLKNDF